MSLVEIKDRKQKIESSTDRLICLLLEIFSNREWLQHHGNSRVHGTTVFECIVAELLFSNLWEVVIRTKFIG